eukprot:CAMPEP_0201582472 /NCGR_PEP_ID=MMETSP0190_2-20130828/85751_1 /ASSEMBLY_ACC=CAM_ASM_000263 /TAXON_ID=37353 /ORGANISM="Rosalina sp." /LENGTH=121 /DNA_ID=CAMNT_0048022467 /DNA_START=215 /DNA_END=580 /DNA_ORIENTATION=-
MLRMYGSDGNDMEISMSKLNVNHDEESQRQNRKDWQKYKPFIGHEQIQEINDGAGTINITNDGSDELQNLQMQEIITAGDDNIDTFEIQEIPTIASMGLNMNTNTGNQNQIELELQEGDIE